jgi:hypothetical protein
MAHAYSPRKLLGRLKTPVPPKKTKNKNKKPPKTNK